MDIIVDTNILISALITPESTITNILLKSPNHRFHAPDYIWQEIINKRNKILKVTKLSPQEISLLIESFSDKLNITTESEV